MKPWVTEVCSSQPEELQIIGPETYIQRRNITAVEHPEQDGTPAYTDYKCESREIRSPSIRCWHRSLRSTPARPLTTTPCS